MCTQVQKTCSRKGFECCKTNRKSFFCLTTPVLVLRIFASKLSIFDRLLFLIETLVATFSEAFAPTSKKYLTLWNNFLEVRSLVSLNQNTCETNHVKLGADTKCHMYFKKSKTNVIAFVIFADFNVFSLYYCIFIFLLSSVRISSNTYL